MSPREYRDTTGVSVTDIQKILLSPDRDTLIGKRDYAMLQLLWGNGLRRAEVVSLDLEDVELGDRSLWVMGKGKDDKERVSLNRVTITALRGRSKVRGTWGNLILKLLSIKALSPQLFFV